MCVKDSRTCAASESPRQQSESQGQKRPTLVSEETYTSVRRDLQTQRARASKSERTRARENKRERTRAREQEVRQW